MEDTILINLLVELADREEELSDLRALRGARNKRLRILGLTRDADREAADEVADQKRTAAKGSRGRQRRIQDTESLLAHKRDQIIGVTDRRQYQAMQREIAGLEKELDRLETAELEYLDEADSASPPELAETFEFAGVGEEAEIRTTEEKSVLAEEEILGEIDRLVGMTPPAVGGHLKRLRGQYDKAAVRVEGRACGGCGGQLPAQQAIDAASGKTMIRCPSCARFVVRHS